MANKILIVGKGYLGTALSLALPAKLVSTDITDIAALRDLIEQERPDIVINTAAKTNTNAAELPEHQAMVRAVNVDGVLNLAYLAHDYHFRLVQVSTGMQFEGRGVDGEGVRETDQPNPKSYYAWTKSWADAALTPFLSSDRILITRIHLPISRVEHPKNLITKLTKFTSAVSEAGSLTVVEDYTQALSQLLKQGAAGIFNVVNPGELSLFAIAQQLQAQGLRNADVPLAPMSKAALDAQVAATGGAYQPIVTLSTKKLEAAGIHLPPIHQAVEELIRIYHHESN